MTLNDLIARARILAHDTSTSNFQRETPLGRNDGTNTHFSLQYKNLVTGSLYLTVNTSYRGQTGFTITSAPQGLIEISPAPGANASPFFMDYCYQWFSDSEYTEFLDDAALKLSVLDPVNTNAGLIDALLQYTLGYFWQTRATQYAYKYASSGGTVGQSVQEVVKAYTDLARLAFDKGDSFRLAFYKRQGQREAPATSAVSYGIDPYTPIR